MQQVDNEYSRPELPDRPTVLLTGAGGAPIPKLIQTLREHGCRVIAVDADKNAAGLYLADAGYVVPLATDSDFSSALNRICRSERVKILVPLVDEELLHAAEICNQEDIQLIGPKPSFTRVCLDKYELMSKLKENGLPVPQTYLLSQGLGNLRFPVVCKPRTGRGSRGVKIVRTETELAEYARAVAANLDRFLIQECIIGTEFSVSVVVWRDGKVRAVVPKEIIEKRGITRIAVSRKSENIENMCRNIQASLSADGPFNVQLILDSRDGVPKVFEINPRFSTTITLTLAAGVDELGGLIDLALGREVPDAAWNWRGGLAMIRQTLDTFVDESEFVAKRSRLSCIS